MRATSEPQQAGFGPAFDVLSTGESTNQWLLNSAPHVTAPHPVSGMRCCATSTARRAPTPGAARGDDWFLLHLHSPGSPVLCPKWTGHRNGQHQRHGHGDG